MYLTSIAFVSVCNHAVSSKYDSDILLLQT